MKNIKLIFLDFSELYEVFNEINNFNNFILRNVANNNDLNEEIKKLDNYLILTNNSKLSLDNQLNFDYFPLKFTKILEKINIAILKINFSNKSDISVGNYKINLNSKEISSKNLILRLTEKEIKMILYISNSSSPVTINELQKEIWGYGQNLETHTVETHVHRLRKKIFESYKDKNFIISTDKGYQIG